MGNLWHKSWGIVLVCEGLCVTFNILSKEILFTVGAVTTVHGKDVWDVGFFTSFL